MMKAIVTLVVALLCAGSAYAQVDHESVRVGVTGAATLNMHQGTLTTQDGLVECGTFEDATTLGFMLGNSVWVPLDESFSLLGKLQYWKADGEFTAPNPVQPNVSLPNGELVRMNSEHQVFTTLDYITLDALALWYPTPSLFIGLGPTIGLNTRAAFEQTETIKEPAFLEFTNGGRERTFLAASFESNGVTAGFRLAATALVGYDLFVTDNIVITPEVGYTYAFTNVLTADQTGRQNDWKVNPLRVGVTIAYAFTSDPEPDPEPEPEPVIEPEPTPVKEAPTPVRTSMVRLESEMSTGSIAQGADVVVHEMVKNDVIPLLPFVFFEKSSATIPDRYHKYSGGEFEEGNLRDSVLGIYHELLNIVGSRMRKHSNSTLSLTGHREIQDGESTADLGLRRANAVKEYIVKRWGIQSSRIKVAGADLPSVHSNRSIQDGREENRRVELKTNDPRILAPVSITEKSRTAEPKRVRVITGTNTPADVQSVSADVIIGEESVASLYASNSDEDMMWDIDAARLSAALGPRSFVSGSVNVSTTFNDNSTSPSYAMATVRRFITSQRFSNEVVNDSLIERFRLIFFDFDRAEVNDFNQPMIELVRSRVRTNSAVRISGLTDRIGPKEHNTQLSLRRAKEVDKVIRQRVIPNVSTVDGRGPELIFNNDLPEGRWYNRTVLIEVATPVDRP